MTSQVFHLVMLLVIGAVSFVSMYGYRIEPWERKSALRWNVAAAAWFFYLFWVGMPEFIESRFILNGLIVLGLALAISARRFFLGLEYLFVKHSAYADVASALRAGTRIDAEATTFLLGDRSVNSLVPGLRRHLHRRQADEAEALREKVQADALLAEAIVRRERAREEAELLKSRRRERSADTWREGSANARVRQQGRSRRLTGVSSGSA